MIINSLELRWFWRREDSSAVAELAERTGFRQLPEVRTDRYLRLPDERTIGIKLREARFEVKYLKATLRQCQISEELQGTIQHWRKWTTAAPDFSPWATREDNWLAVNKKRRQRFFSIDQGQVRELCQRPAPPADCQLELTEISVAAGHKDWISFAIELNADLPDAANTLPGILQTFPCSTFFPANQPAVKSSSYPEWLADLEDC